MTAKKAYTEQELQEKIEQLRKDLDSKLANLTELKAENMTKKQQLVGACVLDKLSNFDGHYINLTPEFLIGWLEKFTDKRGDKKIINLLRVDFGLPEVEVKKAEKPE